jgi:hypothetical protein
MVAGPEQRQAPRLIKAVARQMERSVIARGANALEEVEIELCTRDGAGELGRAGFDASAMGREDCDRRLRPAVHANVEVGAFHLGPGEIRVAAVSSIVPNHIWLMSASLA